MLLLAQFSYAARGPKYHRVTASEDGEEEREGEFIFSYSTVILLNLYEQSGQVKRSRWQKIDYNENPHKHSLTCARSHEETNESKKKKKLHIFRRGTHAGACYRSFSLLALNYSI